MAANFTATGSDTFPDNHVIFHEIVVYGPGSAVSGTSTTLSEINSALRITHTGASTDNIFIFEYACGSMHCSGNQMFINAVDHFSKSLLGEEKISQKIRF